jgi:DNA repair photolyase
MSKELFQPMRGRGALGNPDNRFESIQREALDDGWGNLDEPLEPLRTTLTVDTAKTVINYNQSPDIPLDRSINPYRGCEHGCVYCFARPTHAYLGLSPGLDFETRLFYKPDAATLLRAELGKKNYQCQPIALGINTDAYQPVERQLGLTRQILEVLNETRHPVTIVTKSALIERDIDLLAAMAQQNLVSVALSITTLNRDLSRRLEPRAAAPQRRLETVKRLSDAGIPVAVLVAPLIPVLNDSELETIMEQARNAGAGWAGYVLLRLPHELKELFQQWLHEHEPLKADHVMNRIRDCRGGKEYQSEFGSRMSGEGIFADLLRQRYQRALKRLDFKGTPELETHHFIKPRQGQPQLELF